MGKIKFIEQTSTDYIRQGFSLLEVPKELKDRFELDMQSALMNIAGISISNSTRFIQYEKLAQCYHANHINPFKVNTLTVGMMDSLQLKDFFDPSIVSPEIYSRPIFIHLDLSVNGDKTGIGAVAVMGYKSENRYSVERAETETTKELYYHHIFSCRIQAPTTDEISMQKTRDFIYYLKYQLGWNIWGVSTDGFQSVDMRQSLKLAGFENVDLVSLDRSPDGYITYKYAINEQRIAHLNIPELEFEIVNLARDNQTGKIDHDADKCFTGDTKVKLVDGRDLSILELMKEQEYKTNWVYTINESTHKIEPKPIKKVFQTMITKDLVKVTLDNGESVTCTPNHRFMLRDGIYTQANKLSAGTSLMPIYTKVSGNGLAGYRMYYEPMEDKWHYEHRSFVSGDCKKGYVVHHCNYNKLDNTPTNLSIMSKSMHTLIHNNATRDYSKVSKSISKWHEEKIKDGTQYEINKKSAETRYKNNISKNPNYMRNKDVLQAKRKLLEDTFGVVWSELSKEQKRGYGIKYERMVNPDTKEKVAKRVSENHKLGKYKNAINAISNRMWITDGVNNLYIKNYEDVPCGWHRGRTVKNHKVASVEFIKSPCRVYDLEIEDNHNFGLACGVFVHNSKDEADGICGAVYNAYLHAQDLNLYLSDSYDITLDVNEETFVDSDKDNILQNLVSTSIPYENKSVTYTPSVLESIIDNSSNNDDGFFFL